MTLIFFFAAFLSVWLFNFGKVEQTLSFVNQIKAKMVKSLYSGTFFRWTFYNNSIIVQTFKRSEKNVLGYRYINKILNFPPKFLNLFNRN